MFKKPPITSSITILGIALLQPHPNKISTLSFHKISTHFSIAEHKIQTTLYSQSQHTTPSIKAPAQEI